ncbi:putative ankyrin repeat-containing domain-containing protein [Helianthus annuus]|nr:putative ankyrin repeat-containing domain-containing protein [Helianthus annuus]
MGLEKRTPLMIAAVYGSTNVVKYIIGSGKADVNKVSDAPLCCGWRVFFVRRNGEVVT